MKRFMKKKSILCAVVVAYVVYTFVNQTITMHSQQKEIVRYNQELQRVKDDNQKLQDDINISGTEAYIEKLARERLGLAKYDEEIMMDTK